MATWALIQARVGSTRLPGKVLADVAGRPLLDWVIERVRRARELEGVAVVVPDGPGDAALRRWLAKRDVPTVAGSEHDVLDRYLVAARTVGAEHVVRLTADNPLIDPALVTELVRIQRTRGGNTIAAIASGATAPRPRVRRYPLGVDAEMVSVELLAHVARKAISPADREHVTAYLWRRPDRFPLLLLGAPDELGEERWTVDTERDLVFVRAVFERLERPESAGVADVLELLERHPELRVLNRVALAGPRQPTGAPQPPLEAP